MKCSLSGWVFFGNKTPLFTNYALSSLILLCSSSNLAYTFLVHYTSYVHVYTPLGYKLWVGEVMGNISQSE